jgi:hypothetical protein
MFDHILVPAAQTAVTRLVAWVSKRGFYLAGGTGCALHLGHRRSQDLDFFSSADFSPGDLWAELKKMGDCTPDYTDAGTWVGEFLGTKIGFFHYPYPLLRETVPFQGLALASLEDIGCMKIEAIVGRGRKRDFIDLYFLLREMGFDLGSLLGLFRTKYASSPGNGIHLLKSLVYFIDADSDPNPVMLVEYSWPEIKKKLTALVGQIQL